MKFVRKYLALLHARDKGTVAITFLLSLPILLTLIGILVQYALLINARLTLDRAVAAAARSAVTSLPTDFPTEGTDGPANVRRAAMIALEPLSPASPIITSEGDSVANALLQMGVALPRDFAARYSYAQAASVVQIEPIDANGIVIPMLNYAQSAAPRARITIRYDFRLTVPLANIVGRTGRVAGINGRYLTLVSALDVQLSPGRRVPTNSQGEP